MMPRSVWMSAVRGTRLSLTARSSGLLTRPIESGGSPSARHTVSRIRRSGSRRTRASAASASLVLIAARAEAAAARMSASSVVPTRVRSEASDGTDALSPSWPSACAAELTTVKSRAPRSARRAGITLVESVFRCARPATAPAACGASVESRARARSVWSAIGPGTGPRASISPARMNPGSRSRG